MPTWHPGEKSLKILAEEKNVFHMAGIAAGRLLLKPKIMYFLYLS